MALSDEEKNWYFRQISDLDPNGDVVTLDAEKLRLSYADSINSDETRLREVTPEELVRALSLCMLATDDKGYMPSNFYIEKYYQHGHPSSKRDEVDLVILDADGLPFAMWDFKSAEEYERNQDEFIRLQLFGTAPLVGGPKLLVYATIHPRGETPTWTLISVDYTVHQSFEAWEAQGRPHSTDFPVAYSDPLYEPWINGGDKDIRDDCTQAEFRSVAALFHSEFFAEHPDNTLFNNLLKCLLAKIYDERTTATGEAYRFQVRVNFGQEQNAQEVYEAINALYGEAYRRWIDSSDDDEINPREFSAERVKTVVKGLQSMALTKGAARNGDVIGAFFEEILRIGFKQDKGMYFTHSNLVYFILAAIDLTGLTKTIWQDATHPENRLPYVIDPSCGSGAFLLRAMDIITNAIRQNEDSLVVDFEARDFFDSRMSDDRPNRWAETFIYGIDPKFIMAVTAKVNMVLHGDGSAHIFKYDALRPLSTFSDDKLQSTTDPHRSIRRERYQYDVAENFDVVVSNPPFGITLSNETKRSIPQTFAVKDTAPAEWFFLERWYQLLKPGGRLGVVVPESLLNTTDAAEARLFLYRMFWIRAIVSLPRNVFVETPTLTSLLFAQKKDGQEVEQWDDSWNDAKRRADREIKEIRSYLTKAKRNSEPAVVIIREVSSRLSPYMNQTATISKHGDDPLPISPDPTEHNTETACDHYRTILRLSGFSDIIRNWIFRQVATVHDYEYPVYMVDEVGYKLSKRKEKPRPNQLCRFVDANSGEEALNLNLANAPAYVEYDISQPERVLDFIRRDVTWH